MASVYKSIGKDAFILTIGGILTRASSFLLMPLYTRTFTMADYGTIELLNIIYMIIGILLTMGIVTAFNREFLQMSSSEDERKEAFSTSFLFILISGFVITLLLMITAPWIAVFFNMKYHDSARLIRLVVLQNYFVSVGAIALRYFFNIGKVVTNVLFTFLQALGLMLISVYVVTFVKRDLVTLYEYQFYVSVIFGVFYIGYSFYYGRITFSRQRFKNLMNFALPMIPSSISIYLIDTSDRFFLQKFQDPTQIAIYAVGFKIGMILNILVISPITTAISPYIFKIAREDENYKKIISQLFDISSFLFFSLAVLMNIASPLLIRILATANYVGAGNIVFWIAIACSLFGLNFILVAGINIKGKSYYSMISIVIASVCSIVLNFILIQKYGISGACYATVISYFVHTILTAYFAQRLLFIPYNFARVLTVFIAFVILNFALKYIPIANVYIDFSVKIICYFLITGFILFKFYKNELGVLTNNVGFLKKLKLKFS